MPTPGPTWQAAKVNSPRLDHPVSVVVARDISYAPGGNRLQNLSIYLPDTIDNRARIGTGVDALPDAIDPDPRLPRYHVHVHGGAWRDRQLTSSSIEPAVAHAFDGADGSAPITAIASINYSLSPFPVYPDDLAETGHRDPALQARHPAHVADVLRGLALLRSMGLTDQSYIFSGHSCGACLAFQAVCLPPGHFGLATLPDPPCPAAIVGLNGLYDLVELVHGLGASQENLREQYRALLSNAFGSDQDTWPAASPARFDPAQLSVRTLNGSAPALAVLDQSTEDQLVPMNQRARLEENLAHVAGLRVVRGHQCEGEHAAPWQQGDMLWRAIEDVLDLLRARQLNGNG